MKVNGSIIYLTDEGNICKFKCYYISPVCYLVLFSYVSHLLEYLCRQCILIEDIKVRRRTKANT